VNCRITLKVIPNSSRSQLVGWVGDALKLKVQSPALEGKANEAVVALLAEKLGLPERAVILVHGQKSRQKVAQIEGLDLAAVHRQLAANST